MKRVHLFLAFLIILPTACERIDPQNCNTKDAPVFYASVDETKAGFNYDSGEKTYSHYWNLNDEVAIFPKGSKYDRYHITNASGGVLEMVSAHEGAHTYTTGIFGFNVGVYPYSAVYREGGEDFGMTKFYVNFPTDSPYFDASSPVYGYENLMIAYSEDEHLTFKSMVGWLKVSLKGDFAIKNIHIEGNNNETVSYGGMQYSYNDSYHRLSYLGAGSLNKYRNVRFQAPYPTLSTSSYTDFYIALPSGTLSKGYTLVITKEDDSIVTLVNNASTTINENKVTPTTPISIDDYLALTTSTGFGAESANCYIVSAAGDYHFRSVQGNSNTSVGSVASVSVLWETDNTYTPVNVGDIIKSVSYSPFGYIIFSTPAVFKEGNALIAAKDEGGNILWSWHIWCTDTPLEVTLSYGGATTTFMDRNLGALSATKGDGLITSGLYYYWGRKDPFYISNATTNTQSRDMRVCGTAALPSASDNTDDAKATVEYVTAHPTELVAYGSLWSNAWYKDAPATPFWSNTKTIYDPCPPGYVTYNVNSQDDVNASIFKKLKDAGDKWSYGGSGNFHYMTLTDGTNEVWLPAAGRVSVGSDGQPNVTSYYSTPNASYKGYYLMGSRSPYTGCYGFDFGTSADHTAYTYYSLPMGTFTPNMMYSVRCQKE